jgi:HSP20 family protein
MLAGECSPAIDVFETDDSVEIAVDVPGVNRKALRVLVKGDSLLVIGEKTSRRSQAELSFHLVERGFGRFARTVRLGGSCDPARTRATLFNGELRIVVPKVRDRRGQTIEIAILAE